MWFRKTRKPPVEAALIPSPRPASPCVQCKHAHLYRSASAAGWVTTPALTKPSVTSQPASQPAQQLPSPTPPTTLWF